jgi:hypothetical protein
MSRHLVAPADMMTAGPGGPAEPLVSAVVDAALAWAKAIPRAGFVKPGSPSGRLFDAVKALELSQ